MTNHFNRSRRTIEKVRHVSTGEIGWRVVYGSPSWGGRRVAICATEAKARNVDVSDDVGRLILVRGASGGDCYRDWQTV